MLSVLFIIILGAANGDEMDSDGSDQVYNGSSGQFFFNSNQSIQPNTTWTADIRPPNATNIFIVIEKMMLDKKDILNVTNDNETLLKTVNGTHGPFSFLVDGASLKIVIKTSNVTVTRMFIGYYTELGCIYEINSTFGTLSTPSLHTKNYPVTCSFSLMPQFEAFSKISANFLEFDLQEKLQVIIDGTHNYSYSGGSIPPEIITDKKLEFNFSLHSNDTAKFAYRNVLKESQYVELNNTKQSYKFSYMPSFEKEYYPSGEECHWVIKSEENTTISFKFYQVSLSGITHIVFNDGKNRSSNLLFQASSFNENGLQNTHISSSRNFLWISILQPEKDTIVLGEVTMHRTGGYRKGNGELSIPSNSTEVIYLLEEDGKNVVLDQHKGILTSNSTIYVYSDFSTDLLPIIIYNTSLPNYPIVSSTSRMMVIANNFTGNANYKATFKGINEGCDKMSSLESGEYSLSGNCNTSCKWIVPPVEDLDKVISLQLHPTMFEKQDVTTLNLLDATQTLIVNITSQTNVLPEFYLPSSSGFLLNSIRGNCSTSNNMLHATFQKRKDCSTTQNLKPGNKLSVSSPNFPDSYPFWAHCWTNITITNDTKDGHFLLTFNKIDLAVAHCLKIRHGTGHPSDTKIYEGAPNILPGDLVLNDTVSIEFLAQPCNSTKKQPLNLSTSSGFSLEILSADCGGKIEKEEGNFSTPDFPKNTSAAICTWILEVPKSDSIINFTVTRNDSKDYQLEIYDGSSIRNETLKNHSVSTLLSRTNSVVVVYRRNNSSQTSPGIHVAFHSQGCSTRCMNGLCLHDDWKCNKVNDCGDNSDEIDCESVPVVTTTPAPPAPSQESGVSPVALGLGIPIAFILGIVAAIYLPPLIRRFRSGQYHQFRDVSADA